jgi:hypothetical protein
MFIVGTHTVQFDNVLKSKHGLSIQNRELPLNSMQGRESLNGTHIAPLYLCLLLFHSYQHLRSMRIRIPIQGFYDPKNVKFQSWKIIFFIQKNIFIPRHLCRTFKLQEKPPVLKREHPALHFLLLFVIFVHLDPDPDTVDQNQRVSGSTTLIHKINVFGIYIGKVKHTAVQCLYRLLALSYSKQDATCNDLSVLFKRKNR